MHLLIELVVATGMVLLTVVIHGTGLMAMGRLLAAHDARQGEAPLNPLSLDGALVTLMLVLGLFVLHGVEIWSYALLFSMIEAVPDLREAVYFSTISYGAIGYGDALIAPEWKLLGAIEGINGSILLGWSVAFFVTVMARVLQLRPSHGHHRR